MFYITIHKIVNQALFEAVNKMSWSPGNHLLKIVFLVGDCPPHMDYGDDATYSATCQSAMKKDVIINTIQCGTYPETAQVWQEVARLAEGTYVSIGQTGGMQVISTPMDKALADLNVEIGRTLVPYGSETRMREVKAKQAASESAAAPAAAERLAFNATTGKVVQGGGDLVDDLRSGSAKLEGLKDQDLPAQLRGQTTKEQHAYLDQQAAKRDELQAKITDLVKQRQAYLDAEMKKPAADGKDNSFDSKIAQIIQDQARRKGITYSTELQGLDRSEKK